MNQYSSGVSNFVKYYLFNILKDYGSFRLELIQKTITCLANIIEIPNGCTGKQKLEVAEIINNDLNYENNLEIIRKIFSELEQKSK